MKNFTALQILSFTSPEQLFSRDINECTKEYRKLSMQFHPDRNPSVDSSVFAKISTLYEEAKIKIKSCNWTIPGLLEITSVDDKKFEIKYKIKREFELGEMYIADTHVTYRVENDNKDLIDNFIKHINSFKYIDDSMKKEFQRYMPKLKSKIQTNDFTYLIIEKTEDVISLKDVLEYYKGKLNPKDVAWIISSLSNLACYLKFTNKVHCNLDLNSCFVSPKYHSICILGGWWYTTNHGDKFHALPSRSIDYGNHYLLDTKLSDYSLDLDMIKITAKELLGDISGSKLLMDKTIPKSLVQWLKTSSSNKPVDEYKNWSSKVLKDSFGERKFHEMNLTSKMIYEMHE